jgi:hypothetical protein
MTDVGCVCLNYMDLNKDECENQVEIIVEKVKENLCMEEIL